MRAALLSLLALLASPDAVVASMSMRCTLSGEVVEVGAHRSRLSQSPSVRRAELELKVRLGPNPCHMSPDEVDLVAIIPDFDSVLRRLKTRATIELENHRGDGGSPESYFSYYTLLSIGGDDLHLEWFVFGIAPSGDLELAQRERIYPPSAAIYTRKGSWPRLSFEYPELVVGARTAKRAAAEEAKRLAAWALRDFEIREFNPITIDSLEGYETVASARHKDWNVEVTVYKVVLQSDPDTQYVMRGSIRGEEAMAYLEHFKRTARTFKRR